jgi:hypothetical protein
MQRPTATRVAGFQAWLRLGYCVSRGETAIRIWAPCPPTRKQLEKWRQSGGDPDQRPRTFFKLAAVFADDQVAPLPPPSVPAPLDPPIRDVEGDELAPVIPSLVGLAEEIGCTVAFAPISGGVVDDGLSPNQRVKTLCPWRRWRIRTFGMPGERSLPKCLLPESVGGVPRLSRGLATVVAEPRA